MAKYARILNLIKIDPFGGGGAAKHWTEDRWQTDIVHYFARMFSHLITFYNYGYA